MSLAPLIRPRPHADAFRSLNSARSKTLGELLLSSKCMLGSPLLRSAAYLLTCFLTLTALPCVVQTTLFDVIAHLNPRTKDVEGRKKYADALFAPFGLSDSVFAEAKDLMVTSPNTEWFQVCVDSSSRLCAQRATDAGLRSVHDADSGKADGSARRMGHQPVSVSTESGASDGLHAHRQPSPSSSFPDFSFSRFTWRL